jgi:fructose-specific phosphotransferase system IIC component
MNGVQYIILWVIASAATYLYLFRYQLHVIPTSLVALASWGILAIGGGQLQWPSHGDVIVLDGSGAVQGLCAFLAIVSGFIFVAHRSGAYPTEEMTDVSEPDQL